MNLRSLLRGLGRSETKIDARQWEAVERGLPFLEFLPAADRARLRTLALEFLEQKEFSGAHGFALTDEVVLGIALQACVPILNLGLEWYRGWVGVVVYPGDFVIPRRVMDEHGVMHEYDEPAVGEAWEGGPVLVTWMGAQESADGMNVVIHEFAHKLDMLNGAVEGMPPLHEGMSARLWARAFQSAYAEFCRYVDEGGDPWLDPYAAESPSEFFAVVSEAFFETPLMVREDMPEVYRQLAQFYRQDPAAGEERARAQSGDAGHAGTAEP